MSATSGTTVTRPATSAVRRPSARLLAPPRPAAHRIVDVVVVAVAVLLALVPLVPVFGVAAALPAVVGGVLLGLVVAIFATLRSWPVMTTIATVFIAYAVLGGALAAPSTTIAGVVPTLDTLVALGEGAVSSWKQVLTLEPPLGAAGNALVAPFLLGLAGTVGGGVLATGRRHGVRIAAVAAVPAAILVLSILLGTVERMLATVIGASITVLLLVWAAWRVGQWRPRRRATLAAMAAIAITGGVLVAPVVAGDEPRFVLRSVVVPPFDPRDHTSPLSAYRTFMKDRKETDLLSVSGLPEGAVVRLATMDSFDGVVWNVLGDGEPDGSGSFRKVGDAIPTTIVGERVQVEVENLGLDGVWMPTVGQTTGVRFDGAGSDESVKGFRFNDATGTGVLMQGLDAGQRYTLDAIVPVVPTDEDLGSAPPADVVVPDPVGVPDVVVSRATEVGQNATTAALVSRAIESYLHDTGFFSHGIEASGDYPSYSGHGAARITQLLGDPVMVGDAEQYASAMALMVSQQGLPARVVMGFVPTEEQDGDAEITFTGDNMQAWVEVAYEGFGWVPYFPTPPTSQTPQENDDPIEKEPQPQVVQPPPPPADPVVPPTEDAEEPDVDSNLEETEVEVDVLRIGAITAAIAVPLFLLLLPPFLIVAAKERRRRRRLRAPDPVARISGGWQEVLDTALDHGTSTPADATRRETARALLAAYPRVRAGTLAEDADAAVFAGGSPTDAHVASYWQAVDESVTEIRSRGTAWTRLRGRVSRASLRSDRRRWRWRWRRTRSGVGQGTGASRP